MKSLMLKVFHGKNRKLIPFNAEHADYEVAGLPGIQIKKLSKGIVSKFNILCFKDVNVFLKFTIRILYMV